MNVSAINSAQAPALKTQQKSKTNNQPAQFANNQTSFHGFRIPILSDLIDLFLFICTLLRRPRTTSVSTYWVEEWGRREGSR